MTGAEWPQPSLGVLGAGILAASLVDRTLFKHGLIDRSVLYLRYGLSAGLGLLTIALATR